MLMQGFLEFGKDGKGFLECLVFGGEEPGPACDLRERRVEQLMLCGWLR